MSRLISETVALTSRCLHHFDQYLDVARKLNEAEINAALVRLEVRAAAERPGRWLGMCLGRACDLRSLTPCLELDQVL